MKAIKFIITKAGILIPAFVFTQNLVPNPSFELYTICPNNYGQIYRASPWFQPCIYLGNPTNSSSVEYFNCNNPNVGVPNNYNGYQYAKTGTGYCGIIMGYSTQPPYNNYREYIEVSLTDTLKLNNKYCLGFYVNLSDSSTSAISNLECYFSRDSLLDTIFYQPLPYIPQIKNPIGNIISDTMNWEKISGVYTAIGGEKFITIGNFEYDSNSTGIMLFDSTATFGAVYYYIDDVSVYEIDENFPSNLAGPDVTICNGKTVNIGSSAINGFKYQWQPATGLSSDTVPQPVFTGNQTTTYILTITNDSVPYSCKPTTTDTVTVFVNTLPLFNIIQSNDTVCTGDSVVLTANDNFSYQWSNGDTGVSTVIFPLSDTIISATATENGCSFSNSIFIEVTQTPVVEITASDSGICDGGSAALSAQGGTNYLWSTGEISSSITVAPNNSTIYFLSVFNPPCSAKDSVLISILPLPQLTISPDITIFKGEEIVLSASSSGLVSFHWSPPDYLSCSICSAPLANPPQSIIYILTATTEEGCIATDLVSITVKEIENIAFLPTIFSPNNDGINDELRLRGENISSGELSIFNRWGEKVFYLKFTGKDLNDSSKWWDGTYRGKLLNTGVFVYSLTIAYNDGSKEELKGNITLLR